MFSLCKLLRLIGLYPTASAFVATQVVPLPASELSYGAFDFGTARVHNKRIDRQKKDRSRFIRREAVVLRNRTSGLWTIVRVHGCGQAVEGLDYNGLALTYDTRDELGVTAKTPAEIEVRRATMMDLVVFLWSDHDPFRRAQSRMSLVGMVLGFIGLATLF